MQKHSMNCEYRVIRCSYCSSMISFINKDIHYEDHCFAFFRTSSVGLMLKVCKVHRVTDYKPVINFITNLT